MTAQQKLDRIKEILEELDRRCASKHVIPNPRLEMTDAELCEIYRLATGGMFYTIRDIVSRLNPRAVSSNNQ